MGQAQQIHPSRPNLPLLHPAAAVAVAPARRSRTWRPSRSSSPRRWRRGTSPAPAPTSPSSSAASASPSSSPRWTTSPSSRWCSVQFEVRLTGWSVDGNLYGKHTWVI